FGAVGNGLFSVVGTLAAGQALTDDFGILVDHDAHGDSPQAAAFLTFLVILSAASARLSAVMMGRPEVASIFLPRSTLVPSKRTTRGTLSDTSRAAEIMPSAMMSQRMMPPKILTRMPSTLGSERISLKASVTFSLLAPPPTSRKLAGSPP